MSLVDSAGRSANVVTTEPSRLLAMDRAAFQGCLRTITPLANNLVKLLAHRLRFATSRSRRSAPSTFPAGWPARSSPSRTATAAARWAARCASPSV